MNASKRKLYLHIGNHKTGSTSIQLALARSQDPRIFNIANDELGKAKRLNSWFGNSWVVTKQNPREHSAQIFPKLAPLLGAFNPDGDVIFSSEDLSWIYDGEALVDFEKEIKRHFDEVEIIAHLRRQDRNMVSFYQQGLKSHHSRLKAFAGYEALSLPKYQPYFELYFNYNQRIGVWADVFGEAAINIRVFQDVVGKNIVKDFAEQVKLQDIPKDVHARKSCNKTQQLLLLRLAELDLPFDLPNELAKFLATGTKSLPPRAKAQEFYAHFRDSNIALNARFQVNEREAMFDDDFSEYAIEGNEDWDMASAKEAIDYLLFAHALAREKHRESDATRQKLRRQLTRMERRYEKLAKDSEKS